MRVIFAGTPPFAAVQLAALVAAHHEVMLVLTQPDRPSGRGLQPIASAVKQAAIEARIELLQPASLKSPSLQSELGRRAVDAWVVAAYGLIVPAAILQAPRFGCLNIHASLLPRWRGAAPLQRAIMAGDTETGITIMQMDEGLDTGPVLLRRAVPILPSDTGGSLHDRLAQLGAQLILEALEGLAAGVLTPVPQEPAGACYASKLTREDLRIDWSQPAQSVARMIRALHPTPGAYTFLRDQTLKIWGGQAHDTPSSQAPGTVLSITPEGIHVACGIGVFIVAELQRSGGKRLAAEEFVRGFPLRSGERFGA